MGLLYARIVVRVVGPIRGAVPLPSRSSRGPVCLNATDIITIRSRNFLSAFERLGSQMNDVVATLLTPKVTSSRRWPSLDIVLRPRTTTVALKPMSGAPLVFRGEICTGDDRAAPSD